MPPVPPPFISELRGSVCKGFAPRVPHGAPLRRTNGTELHRRQADHDKKLPGTLPPDALKTHGTARERWHRASVSAKSERVGHVFGAKVWLKWEQHQSFCEKEELGGMLQHPKQSVQTI